MLFRSQYEFDKMRPTLLVVDDEIEMLWFIGEIFSGDFNVVTLQDPERLDQVMNEVYPNVIICDVMMPGVGGVNFSQCVPFYFHVYSDTLLIFLASSVSVYRMSRFDHYNSLNFDNTFDNTFLNLRRFKTV